MDFLARFLLRVWLIVLGDMSTFNPLDKRCRVFICIFFNDGRGSGKIIRSQIL